MTSAIHVHIMNVAVYMQHEQTVGLSNTRAKCVSIHLEIVNLCMHMHILNLTLCMCTL